MTTASPAVSSVLQAAAARRGVGARSLPKRLLAAALALASALPVPAATSLADQPLFVNSVPGNLALPLSVEFPTAISVAHPDGTYSSANTYLGYFDPAKCYLYQVYATETETQKSHFYPAGLATSRTCVGTNDAKWSGNFLNWATMQTIDPFRWALTGGFRIVDTASTTILEKAWASNQGGDGNFPARNVSDATTIAGATPFRGTSAYQSQIRTYGVDMVITANGGGENTGGLSAEYYNNTTLTAPAVLVRNETVDFNWGNGSPGTGVNVDNFSARWTSAGLAPTTGSYNFQTESDDGVRLYVNNVLVINNWTDHAPVTDTSANITFTQGDPVNIRLEFYERGGGAVARLRWRVPGSTSYVVYSPGTPTPSRLAVRVKVCDPSATAGGIESNCEAYGSNYKPQGLMQKYADRIRYSVFGYLNDNDLRRDGGVLRARQKFIGPTYPRPGLTDAANPALEWDAATGIYVTNPDAADATATAAATAFNTPVSNSGVLNYLNKFGSIARGNYKTYDPVGELYYAALRYFKNLGNVPSWSSPGSADAAQRAVLADGFPVIDNWQTKPDGSSGDPIQYACQRNFILGIGDTHAWADKNVPGSGMPNNSEPTRPTALGSDGTDAVAMTNRLGAMEGLGASLGTQMRNGTRHDSWLMAGLAYEANTKDIRPDLANPAGTIGQTVQTFWLDVLEDAYETNNQFYLATKYGGFAVPEGFNSHAAGNAALNEAWWHTNTETIGGQLRPDNYYTAAKADQMVDGLKKAFADISSKLRPFTTSFATSLPVVAQTDNASYSALYDAGTWTGEVIGSTLSFDATTGEPSTVEKWRFSSKLQALAGGTGWSTARRIVTWKPASGLVPGAGAAFRHASLSTTQQGQLDTAYRSGDDSSNYLDYLRGDRSQEQASTVTGSSKAYRTRTSLVGDIIGSKAKPVGPPSLGFSNTANPGYTAFKSTWAARPTVVYIGTNAGMLHAINGSITEGDTNAGTELFAYVPGALYAGPNATPQVDGLAAIGKQPEFVHHQYVNATPNVYDVDFNRTVGASGLPDWRSVLIGGLGKGGRSYYAIDVTDPAGMTTETAAAAKVLWEFSHADLGYGYGEPVVVKTKKYGWVVLIGSGYNNSDGGGYFFLLNPRTGALIKKIGTGVGSVANDAGLAHVNAFVPDRTDATADAAYAGDLQGNVWRLDLTDADGNYPAPTQLATLKDAAGAVQPVTSRLIVDTQPGTNKRFVLVGTGKALHSSDIAATQAQSFYALIDGTGTRFNSAAQLPSGVTFPLLRSNLVANTPPPTATGVAIPADKMGWYFELNESTSDSGWRVVSDPVTYFGTVAFVSTKLNSSACSPGGTSRVYALDFGSGASVLTSPTDETTIIPYSTALTGVVTDLRFYKVNGKTRLITGDATGQMKSEKPKGLTSTLRRINWRELPLAD